jgi:patatin-like phospholipase/acyl hydrolase
MNSGGVRGIVILEVLRNIEQELGGGIKVQEFFDLIVGTRSVILAHSS